MRIVQHRPVSPSSALVLPSMSEMPSVVAVSSSPTCAVPEIPGAPVAAKLPNFTLTVTSWPGSQAKPEGEDHE